MLVTIIFSYIYNALKRMNKLEIGSFHFLKFLLHLQKAINISVREQGLQLWPHQIDKVKQFYNQILVRHGVMLVGPTGGGKTTVRSILQKALIMLPTILPQEDKEDGKKTGYVVNKRNIS